MSPQAIEKIFEDAITAHECSKRLPKKTDRVYLVSGILMSVFLIFGAGFVIAGEFVGGPGYFTYIGAGFLILMFGALFVFCAKDIVLAREDRDRRERYMQAALQQSIEEHSA